MGKMFDFKRLTSTKLIVVLIITLLMAGCGGSGDDSTTPSEPITYHLYDDGQFDPGYQLSFSLTGSDSTGGSWTGTVLIETKSQVQVSGQTVVPMETYVSLTETSSSYTADGIGTTYTNPNTLITVLMEVNGVTYTPTDTSVMPELAEIGDSGALPAFSGSDGSTITGTWRLEDAGGGLADLVQQTFQQASPPGGPLDYNTTVRIRIDETGNPSRYSEEIYYPSSGVSVNLSS